MVGAVTFTGNGGKFRSTLPLLPEGETATSFLHMVQSPELRMFTGLAILNAGATTTRVVMKAFGTEGTPTAETEVELHPGQRVVDVLNGPQFFGEGFSQVGGHLELSSGSPVFSFLLFGDLDSEVLSAVEGQTGLH